MIRIGWDHDGKPEELEGAAQLYEATRERLQEVVGLLGRRQELPADRKLERLIRRAEQQLENALGRAALQAELLRRQAREQ